LALNGGTITDAVGNTATLTLATPGNPDSLGANKALVINDKPVVGADETETMTELTKFTFTVDNTATDLETDPITYLVATAPATGTIIDCMDQSGSSGGTDLTCTYVPDQNFAIGSSNVTFTYKANDGNNDSIANATITLRPPLPEPQGLFFYLDNATDITLQWRSGGGRTSQFRAVYQAGAVAPADCNSGTQIGSDSSNTYAEKTGLTSNTEYSYRVCSIDSGSNLSAGITNTFKTTPMVAGMVSKM
jgi:hypothetical protein